MPFRNTVTLLDEERQKDDQDFNGFTRQVESKSRPGAVSRAMERGDANELNSLAQTALQAYSSVCVVQTHGSHR